MGNFIGLVYATLKKEGIDTTGMSAEEAVKKYNELNDKHGDKKNEGKKTNEFTKTREQTLKNEGYEPDKMTKEEQNAKYSELEKPLKQGTPAEQQRLKDLGIDTFFKNKNIEETIKERNGTTKNWKETGYLFVDGSQIDLSGRRWGGTGGKRDEDHRDVFEEEDYDDGDNTDAMIELMARGNIRVAPEYPNINLQVEPTETQYRQIENMVNALNGNGFTVELDDRKGRSKGALEYEGVVNPKQVIEDMKYYFRTGKIEQY